jgi:hypothetical protein
VSCAGEGQVGWVGVRECHQVKVTVQRSRGDGMADAVVDGTVSVMGGLAGSPSSLKSMMTDAVGLWS